jgi:hypothetical protein
MRTRDFCNRYGIWVTSAVRQFWRKKKETRTDPNESYRMRMEEIQAENERTKRVRITDDIDPYYR